jgi:hypothetical protein
MKSINIIVTVAAVALIIALSALEPRRESTPSYNTAAETKVAGVIQDVSEFFCPVSDDQGMHVLLKSDSGNLLIHVAPARFLRGQEIRFSPGQQLEVVGAQVKFQGRDSLLARQITRGNELIVLRDHSGKPVWMN